MPRYIATQNVPGYLPMADEPDVFDSAEMAWDYLLSERNTDLDNFVDIVSDGVVSLTANDDVDEAIVAMEAAKAAGAIGSVVGTTPGYDGDHDLGLVYSVSEYEA